VAGVRHGHDSDPAPGLPRPVQPLHHLGLRCFQPGLGVAEPAPSKDYFLISVYSFQESFRVSQYGLGSAAAVVMVAILVVVTFFYVRQTVRLTNEAV